MRFLFLIGLFGCQQQNPNFIKLTLELDSVNIKNDVQISLFNNMFADTQKLFLSAEQQQIELQLSTGFWTIRLNDQQGKVAESIINLQNDSNRINLIVSELNDHLRITRKKEEQLLVSNQLGQFFLFSPKNGQLHFLVSGASGVRLNSDIIALTNYSGSRIDLYSVATQQSVKSIEIPKQFRTYFQMISYNQNDNVFSIDVSNVTNVLLLSSEGRIIDQFEGHTAFYSKFGDCYYYLNNDNHIWRYKKGIKNSYAKIKIGTFSLNYEGDLLVSICEINTIIIFDLKSGEHHTLEPLRVKNVLDPHFSKDSRYIFFNSFKGQLTDNLYRIDSDGTNLTLLSDKGLTVRSAW